MFNRKFHGYFLLYSLLFIHTEAIGKQKNSSVKGKSQVSSLDLSTYSQKAGSIRSCSDYAVAWPTVPSAESLLEKMRSLEEPKKGEFETQAKFDERMHILIQTFLGTKTIILKKRVSSRYDIDRGVMTITLPIHAYYYSYSMSLQTIRAGGFSKYEGQNAFGGTAQVTSSNWSELLVTFENINSVPNEIYIPMRPYDAASFKETGQIEIVSTYSAPYISVLRTHDRPSISRPYEHRTKVTRVHSRVDCAYLTWAGGFPRNIWGSDLR